MESRTFVIGLGNSFVGSLVFGIVSIMALQFVTWVALQRVVFVRDSMHNDHLRVPLDITHIPLNTANIPLAIV